MIELRPCEWMTERKQVNFPKTRKKRIEKKWRKRSSNWAIVPKEDVLVMGSTIMGHPTTLEKLRAKMQTYISPPPPSVTFENLMELVKNLPPPAPLFMDMKPPVIKLDQEFNPMRFWYGSRGV